MRYGAGLASIVFACAATFGLARGSSWQPPGIAPTTASIADVLAAHARAAGVVDARMRRRRERWTYLNGARRITVDVAVRDDDFRTSLALDGLTYMAGRRSGARWRADGNGIVHGVQGDLQGDAIDRAPQAVFPLDTATWTLVGEVAKPQPAWVILADRPGDKPAFLSIDKATGAIDRETIRDGRRIVTTVFDCFESIDGSLRARHWRVDDGRSETSLDVTVDAVVPGLVETADIAFPARRVLAPAAALERSVELDSSFNRGRISLRAMVAGSRRWFLLDTGTASITVDPSIGARYGGATLEHAVLPSLEIGPLTLERVSTLAVPFNGGAILGLDFFFGHVIEIDYRHERVRILSASDARDVFADPRTAVVEANVDQGLPLVAAGFGRATSDSFAVDTGSPRLYVMRSFAERYASEIAAHWTPVGRPFVEQYLEGRIEVQPHTVARFDFARASATDIVVGLQLPDAVDRDDLAIPFDGIIGTEVLENFDLFFDYDDGRLGVRR